MSALEARQSTLLDQQFTYEQMLNRTIQILRELEKSQTMLVARIAGLAEEIQEAQKTNFNAFTTITSLNSRLHITEERLIDTARDWKRGILNPKFLQTFNISIPCNGSCPAHLLKPRSCFFDPLRQHINFAFTQRTVKQHAQILKADPFALIRKLDAEETCFAHYRGPGSVIFDASIDCVTPLNGNTNAAENIILTPSVAYCSDSTPNNASESFWNHIECTNNKLLRPEEIIQIKTSNEMNFIYCFTLQVHVFNRTYPCPSHVFSLPHYASFRIGKMTYTADQLQLSNTLHVAPVHTSRINFHLIPVIPDFDKPLAAATDLTSSLNERLDKHREHGGLPATTYVMITAVAFSIALLFAVLRRRSAARQILVSRRSQTSISKTSHDSESTAEEQPTPSPRSGQRPPTPKSTLAKHTLFVSIFTVALSAQAASSPSCPATLSQTVTARICPQTTVNSTFASLCSAIQTENINTAYSLHCTADKSSPSPQQPETPAMPILLSIATVPLHSFRLLAILSEWKRGFVADSLLQETGISTECYHLYRPNGCALDSQTSQITFHLARQFAFTTPLMHLFPTVAPSVTPAAVTTVLLATLCLAIAVLLGRRRVKYRFRRLREAQDKRQSYSPSCCCCAQADCPPPPPVTHMCTTV